MPKIFTQSIWLKCYGYTETSRVDSVGIESGQKANKTGKVSVWFTSNN